jgi:anti-sigma regulatory factor (Ser/Thr protein kinase)
MTPDPITPQAPAHRLASFEVASVPGNEREVLDRVARAVAGQLPPERLDRLKTAVAEATLNAIEHGHDSQAELAVGVEVTRQGDELVVAITDHGPARSGAGDARPPECPEEPDLTRKLAGEQSPRGWGLFLIRHMVDAMDVVTKDGRHIVRLAMRAGGD